MSDTGSVRWLLQAGIVCFRLVQGMLLAMGLVTLALVVTGRGPSLSLSSGEDMFQAAEVSPYLMLEAGVTAPDETVALKQVSMAQGGMSDAVNDTQLSAEMILVRDWVSRRYRVSAVALEPVLSAAEFAGRSEGIDPLLIVAVMAVESRFNPFAESHMGAQGLMQVIPRFHMEKISLAGGDDADDLFDPAINIHVGAKVLREGLLRYGSLNVALQYYAGALNDPKAGYAQKVLTVRQQLMAEAKRVTQPITVAQDV